MTDLELRALLTLMMCSDPRPAGTEDVLEALLDRESNARGFANWIVAYHDFKP